MIALALQIVGLVGLPVGGHMVADAGGLVVGLSIVTIYIGIAIDRAGF